MPDATALADLGEAISTGNKTRAFFCSRSIADGRIGGLSTGQGQKHSG